MEVKVVSVTKSLVEGIELSAEELLVYIARVSNPSNQMNKETSEKLIKYLIAQKHWSPFDMVNFALEVKTSRAISAQILRHWSIKPQEFSQRYAEAVGIEPIELRLAGSTTRQGSGEEAEKPWLQGRVEDHIKASKDLYLLLLNEGIAKECARMVLPLATSTTLILNGSVRSWIHYLEQRLSAHAQKEHRLLATEVEKAFMEHFPCVYKACKVY